MKPMFRRVLAKTLTYKLLTFLTGIGVFGYASGDYKLAAGASVILVVLNTGIYVLHELVWSKTRWGRKLTTAREFAELHGLAVPEGSEYDVVISRVNAAGE